MTNYYVRTGFVPERNKYNLTENKLYKVLQFYSGDKGAPQILKDDGILGTMLTKNCAYLDYKQGWELLEGISKENLLSLISQTKNSIFTVKFIKKDGTERKLTGMFGVKKHLKHEDRKPTVDTDKFFVIFDMFKKDYRAVNKDTIFEARIKGKNYIVEDK